MISEYGNLNESSLDTIRITGISATGYHGVLQSEREAGQEFIVDLTLSLGLGDAAEGDDLDKTVNYAHISEAVVEVLTGAPVNLIETVAERVAAVVLENPLVQAVAVTVHKPAAPIPVPFGGVEVTVRRSRTNLPRVSRPFAEVGAPAQASLPSWAEVDAQSEAGPTDADVDVDTSADAGVDADTDADAHVDAALGESDQPAAEEPVVDAVPDQEVEAAAPVVAVVPAIPVMDTVPVAAAAVAAAPASEEVAKQCSQADETSTEGSAEEETPVEPTVGEVGENAESSDAEPEVQESELEATDLETPEADVAEPKIAVETEAESFEAESPEVDSIEPDADSVEPEPVGFETGGVDDDAEVSVDPTEQPSTIDYVEQASDSTDPMVVSEVYVPESFDLAPIVQDVAPANESNSGTEAPDDAEAPTETAQESKAVEPNTAEGESVDVDSVEVDNSEDADTELAESDAQVVEAQVVVAPLAEVAEPDAVTSEADEPGAANSAEAEASANAEPDVALSEPVQADVEATQAENEAAEPAPIETQDVWQPIERFEDGPFVDPVVSADRPSEQAQARLDAEQSEISESEHIENTFQGVTDASEYPWNNAQANTTPSGPTLSEILGGSQYDPLDLSKPLFTQAEGDELKPLPKPFFEAKTAEPAVVTTIMPSVPVAEPELDGDQAANDLSVSAESNDSAPAEGDKSARLSEDAQKRLEERFAAMMAEHFGEKVDPVAPVISESTAQNSAAQNPVEPDAEDTLAPSEVASTELEGSAEDARDTGSPAYAQPQDQPAEPTAEPVSPFAPPASAFAPRVELEPDTQESDNQESDNHDSDIAQAGPQETNSQESDADDDADRTQIIPVISAESPDSSPAGEINSAGSPASAPSGDWTAGGAGLDAADRPQRASALAPKLNDSGMFPKSDQMDEVPSEPARVVLALGANLGDAQATLRGAVEALKQTEGFTIVKVGPLALTGAVGGPEQNDYYNTVVIGETTLSPRELLHATQAIENANHRTREVHWGPRTLDIDIITYGSVVATADDLEIPHPRANERAFVLVPWEEADPSAYLPGLGGGPVSALAATAPDRPGVRWLALNWLS